jgi:tRNA(Arg) A34 adenosine deaminase TadA
MAGEFDTVWSAVAIGIRRSLELAHASLLSGGLPVGAVVLDDEDSIVAEGRNRAYDAPDGGDRLQRSPIAHAEMNALAAVNTDTNLSSMRVWSSHRPCMMCAAACAFVEVGQVLFVAPDPSDADHSDPAEVDHRWAVVANLLFLAGVRAYSGESAPMITRAANFEPEVVHLLISADLARLYSPTLGDSLAAIWPLIDAAAEQRGDRLR